MSPHHRDATRATSSVVVSVYFADASAELRAQLSLSPERVGAVSQHIADGHGDLECVLLSTCNRTTLVLAGQGDVDPARAITIFHEALGIAPIGSEAPCLAGARSTIHVGPAATEHVFRLACGLESQVLGDTEILGQLRRAWRTAHAAGWAGHGLRTLFRDALAVGKRARSSTDISAGGAGVASAVMAAIGDRNGPVVVIGAGTVGRTVARRLAKHDRQVTIANRTLLRAQQLAAEVGGVAVGLGDLDDVLIGADVVVNAVGAELLDRARLQRLRRRDPAWTPLILDLAAAPSVDPTDGFDVVDLQRLQQRGDAALERRRASVSAVEALVEDALTRHHRSRTFDPYPAGANRRPNHKEEHRARADR